MRPALEAAAAPLPQSKPPLLPARALSNWRLDDVTEDDIDIGNWPAITAIHYNLSPSETLEGANFGLPADAGARNDDDDDEDTIVLDH
jgi:hypothetical protein